MLLHYGHLIHPPALGAAEQRNSGHLIKGAEEEKENHSRRDSLIALQNTTHTAHTYTPTHCEFINVSYFK